MSETCRLCSTRNLQELYRFPNCEVQRCGECGFTQVARKPRGEEVQAVYGNDYFTHSKYENKLAVKLEERRRLRWLKRAGLPHGAKVLDVGCATGEFVLAAKKDYEVWGIDISEHAIRIAKDQNPDRAPFLRACAFEDLGLEGHRFDALVMWDVLEHLWDPRGVISKVKTILKPGGLLCVSTPNIGATVAKLMGRRWAFMTPPEHLCFFRKRNLVQLLDNCGFMLQNWMSRGKWINVGFLIYKASRVMPALIPRWLAGRCRTGLLGKPVLYVPTGDIQYAVARLKE